MRIKQGDRKDNWVSDKGLRGYQGNILLFLTKNRILELSETEAPK